MKLYQNIFMEKIRLRVLELGIADNHADNYILILDEDGGNRRLPIVMPSIEAQAIVVQLEKISLARPLIHDLFFSAFSSFGVEMLEVNITDFENGVFSSEIVLFDGERELALNARISDAIALALHFRCPIFATPSVMNFAGITIEESEEDFISAPDSNRSMTTADFKSYSNQELEKMLDDFVESEEYELATAVRDELRRRNDESS